MDKLNEFYKKIQMYLMKKSQECGELKLLTSCITYENSNHIDDICKSIMNIFQTYNIDVSEKALINNEICVQSYKYLLLNTDFKYQERLAEDLICGHLVDMCPLLSPYLFIQILWHLEYEKILIESLLYIPFDLCTEILKIITKYINKLPFQRSVNIMYQLMSNVYIKFLQLRDIGIQSTNPENSILNLLLAFQEFLLVITNSKLFYLTDVSDIRKYERHGIMLKKFVCTLRKCLENKNKGISISKDLEKLYNITFGREAYTKCGSKAIEDTIQILNEELTKILLNKLKEIDCNTYLYWAQIDDEENSMISLQQSIRIENYYFMEFVMNDEQLSEDKDLVECLEKLASKPDPKQSDFVLNIQELCSAISDGKTALMNELLCRYKEWDCSTLYFIYNNISLSREKVCLTLLNHLRFVYKESVEEDLKECSLRTFGNVILNQSIQDTWEIVLMYLMKYDGKTNLEFLCVEEGFRSFITQKTNLRKSKNLKIVLFFLSFNPRIVLSVLLKITIGHADYGNIMISPTDLTLLSPLMAMREDNNQIFLISTLKIICIENTEWNAKKFIDFVEVMLDNSIIKIHDLINNVFIPYLYENSLNASNMNSILNIIDKYQDKCTKATNIKDLIIALIKRMSSIRKNTNISRYISNEIISQITRILHYFLETKGLFTSTRMEIINSIESIVEPIERLHFESLWCLIQKGNTIIDIVEDYERRCFMMLNQLKENPKISTRSRDLLSNLNLSKEDFLRHLIIRSTGEEYKTLGSDTITYWFAFGWNDEIDAYSNFLRLTIEACCLSLKYPSIFGTDVFLSLFEALTQFFQIFISLEGIQNYTKICQVLIKNITQLEGSLKHTPYDQLFTGCLTNLNKCADDNPAYLTFKIINAMYNFNYQCLQLNQYNKICEIPDSIEVSNFYTTHEIISTCMKVPATDANECIKRMNELFVQN